MLANFGEMVVRELEKEKILEAQKHEAKALSQVKDSALRAINRSGWPNLCRVMSLFPCLDRSLSYNVPHRHVLQGVHPHV